MLVSLNCNGAFRHKLGVEPPVSIRPQPAEIECDSVEGDGSHFVLILENSEQQPVAAGIFVNLQGS
jgi:hypothetical protein